jgi:hypothetical protein
MSANLRRAPLRGAPPHRILGRVKRTLHVEHRRPRIYHSLPVLLLLLVGGGDPARGQVGLSVDPAMTKGPATAPVTIVEFTDYQ